MSKVSFDIKIGKNTEQLQPQVSMFRVEAHMNKQQILNHKKRTLQKLDIKKMPLVFFKIPSQIAKQHVPVLNKFFDQDQDQKQFNCTVKQKIGSNNYYLLHPIDPKDKVVTLIKKIQKVFSQLNTLNNTIYFQIKVYNIFKTIDRLLQKHQNVPFSIWSVLLDHCDMQGHIDVDGKFYTLFCQLVQKISPKFANSPITALTPLLQSFDFQLQLQSINDIPANLNTLDKNITCVNQKLLLQVKQIPDKNVYAYLWFGQLGYVKITISVGLLPFILTF